MHGYDVADHARINPELGGAALEGEPDWPVVITEDAYDQAWHMAAE